MLEAIGRGISKITGIDEERCIAIIYSVRDKVKQIRRRGELSIDEIVKLSRSLIGEQLGVDDEIVYRGIARGVIDVDPDELLFDDTREVLNELKKKHKIIVIGNVMIWPSPYTRLLLEKTGVAKYIDKQYYADEIGYYKPMKEAFLKPLREQGVDPSEAVHVGDSTIEDYEGAYKAGLTAIKIDRSVDGVKTIDERRYIVGGLSDILEIIK